MLYGRPIIYANGQIGQMACWQRPCSKKIMRNMVLSPIIFSPNLIRHEFYFNNVSIINA